jgi:hypothetical protein
MDPVLCVVTGHADEYWLVGSHVQSGATGYIPNSYVEPELAEDPESEDWQDVSLQL